MKIRQTIGHDKDWRRVPLGSWGRCFGGATGYVQVLGIFRNRRAVIPELDLTKEGFCVRSLVSPHFLGIFTAVLLGEYGVSARRQYEEVANHDLLDSCSNSCIAVAIGSMEE